MTASKYNEETVKQICDAIDAGLTVQSACDVGGISKPTYYEWQEQYPDFLNRIKASVAKKKTSLIEAIKLHGKNHWQALAWILERTFPDEYSMHTKQDIKQVVSRFGEMTDDELETALDKLTGAENE